MNNALKQCLHLALVLWVGVFALPGFCITPLSWQNTEQVVESTSFLTSQTVQATPTLNWADDEEIMLRVLDGDTVMELSLSEYLVGVIRAEMPASFHIEALKAQACAARTYTVYQILNGSTHGDTADICTDYTCCQAYTDADTAALNWGNQAAEYESRIRSAVYQTNGETIDYDGSPILAVFHASSAGQTRQAGAVWVSDLPYLQSVDSPETAQTVPSYNTEVTFTQSDLRQILLTLDPAIVLGDDPTQWLSAPVTESGGSVISLTVGGCSVSGTTLRSALGLRSACFTWQWDYDSCTFFVTGYGHGVGLSQYGANTMALDGATYQEILTHYYSGVTLSTQSVATMAQALQVDD